METKKFRISKTEKVKGGRNNTHTVLSAAGITAFGGASAVAGYAAAMGVNGDATEIVPPAVERDPQNQEAQPKPEHEPQNSQTEPVQGQNADEYQPTDGSTNGGQSSTINQSVDSISETGDQEPDLDPYEVAQALVNEIDSEDIDVQNVLAVDGFDTMYGQDGSEIAIATVHASDGTQFLLADRDGDGVYSDVFDLSGNYVGEAEGNLTASDLADMFDDTGGYLAVNDNPMGDDPMNGITNTEENESSSQVDVSDEELIAMVDDEPITDPSEAVDMYYDSFLFDIDLDDDDGDEVENDEEEFLDDDEV